MYIRFIATLSDINQALDDYAKLPPDYIQRNPSVTAELVTGCYNGGHYAELINLVDILNELDTIQHLDDVNYARVITELIKAKTKLGYIDDAVSLIDDAFEKKVLFLPLAYSEIITVCVSRSFDF